MFDKFLYMATLDEIDPSLPEGELTIRRIAKHGSRVMGFIGWLLLAVPMIAVSAILGSSNFISAIIVNGALKPNRYIWYQIIYWILKIPMMLVSNSKKSEK